MTVAESEIRATEWSSASQVLGWLAVAGLIYVLLTSVGLIGAGLRLAAGGTDSVAELFAFAANPVTGVLIGALATALVQSSSSVTAAIVGLVAGGLPVSLAIPIVMGANIGTTVTNTLVSLAYARKNVAFKRAFAAATVHDMFNILAVILLLPLEIAFGILDKASGFLAGLLTSGTIEAGGLAPHSLSLVGPVVKAIVAAMTKGAGDVAGPVLLAASGAGIILSVLLLSRVLKQLMVGRARDWVRSAIGKHPATAIASGTLVTAIVQSSSTTTSLMIPMASAGVVRLKQIYPFTLGTNIGTTVTSLIAAFGVSTAAAAALQIALVHFLFNVFAVAVIYGLPFLRNIPIFLAQSLARLARGWKLFPVIYVLFVFFTIPALAAWLASVL